MGRAASSGHQSLRGYVVSSNIEHPCALFECKVPEYDGPVTTLYPQKPFLDWTYSGPILNLPDELDNTDYMMGEIDDRWAERQAWSDEDLHDFVMLTERFARCSKYDISAEMNDYRRRLIVALRDSKLEALNDVTEELGMASGRTGRETMGGEVLDFWKPVMYNPQNRSATKLFFCLRRAHCTNLQVRQPKGIFHSGTNLIRLDGLD